MHCQRHLTLDHLSKREVKAVTGRKFNLKIVTDFQSIMNVIVHSTLRSNRLEEDESLLISFVLDGHYQKMTMVFSIEAGTLKVVTFLMDFGYLQFNTNSQITVQKGS